MSDPTPADPEARRLRAARRFGRIGLAITIVWMLLVPVAAILGGPPDLAYGVPLAVLYLAALTLHLTRIRQHVRSLGDPAPPWFVAPAVLVGLAITLIGLSSGFTGFVWGVVGGVMVADLVAGLRARWAAVVIVAAMAVTASAGYVVSVPVFVELGLPLSPWVGVAPAVAYVGVMWTLDVERLWWLKAVTDLDGSRRVAAELATARERLRLGDDLHDILGHALEVVAFKSELAARLIASDTDHARRELEEVQRVARQSLAEVRSLARDARSTDLASELDGARAVLDSAGVRLEVSGDPAEVDPVARPVLGRVLREAMTNVLRHSRPSRCSIAIEVEGGRTSLRVVNDGVLTSAVTTPGSGLTALRRHLEEQSGRLDAGPSDGGRFRLDASMPVSRS